MPLIFLLLAAEAVVPPLAPAAADPLAPARRGLIECTQPDATTKTCQSIARYTLNKDGTYTTVAEIALVPGRPVTFEITSQSVVRGTEVCGKIEASALRQGVLRAKGEVVPEERAALAREKIVGALSSVIGQEICVSYHPSGQGVVEVGRMVGYDKPLPPRDIAWIAPDAGYRVAPAAQ